MIRCPTCGHENPEGSQFCNSCGSALAAASTTPREERKFVTVLFADLVGFTSRAERMDPEDVRAVLDTYHERVRHELERFGGTVEKFIGDAVMAVFGAPQTHEDDPERAVRAALAIRDWVREEEGDLQVRVGVNTGEVLVALGARPSEGESMVAGDVVNSAARLQAGAPVNGILVGDMSFSAGRPEECAERVDELLALNPMQVGVSHPINPVLDLAWILTALGRAQEFLDEAAKATVRNRWLEAGIAFAGGDVEQAAEICSQIGVLPNEAYTRLKAAEKLLQEGRIDAADVQLEKALAFYRSVRADAYIREAEGLQATYGSPDAASAGDER